MPFFTEISFETFVTLVVGVLGGGGFVNALLSKRKINAESRKISINTDIMIGEAWKAYAEQMKQDLEAFKELTSKEINELKAAGDQLKGKFIDEVEKRKKCELVLKKHNIALPYDT